jgi:hypothetical protein
MIARRSILLFVVLFLALLALACPPKPPAPKVWVKACNSFPDTPASEARIANEFCPATHGAQYVKGAEPKEICTLHKAPPVIPTTAYPRPEVHFLVAANYTYYSGLVLTPDALPEDRLLALYDRMATSGMPNGAREFAAIACAEWVGLYRDPFVKEAGKWDLDRPSEEYWNQVVGRLEAAAARKLTTIVALVDNCSTYAGSTWEVNPWNGRLNVNGTTTEAARFYDDPPTVAAFLRWVDTFVDRTKHVLPYIIYETANEGGNFGWHRSVISHLLTRGVPLDNIQIEWWDSSEYWELLSADLQGKGLAATHCVGSERSVDWYRAGAKHDYLLPAGDYPSSDGPDFYGEAKGLKGKWWPDQAKRPNNSQQTYIVATIRSLGGRGFEHLSAVPMINQDLPSLDDALSAIGDDERAALLAGYLAGAPLAPLAIAARPAGAPRSLAAPRVVAFRSLASLRGKKR